MSLINKFANFPLPSSTRRAREDDVETLTVNSHSQKQEHPLDVLFDQEVSSLRPELQDKVANWKDAIQPHTDEGGDAYHIGDAYENIDPDCADEWRLANPGPYLQYVKRLAMGIPSLDYLANWMQVTTSPPKWKFVRKYPASRAERAQRVRACVVDYGADQRLRREHCDSPETLRNALRDDGFGHGSRMCHLRVIVVEDLSRDLIELLGGYYDVDPRFFREFLHDFLFYNTRDRWVEIPSLLLEDQTKSYSISSFLRARFYMDEHDFSEAERQSGMFNVLRRLDSDRNRVKLSSGAPKRSGSSAALCRSKVAIWTRPASAHRPAIAILLTDPTTLAGKPLWGGFETAPDFLSMNSPGTGGGITHSTSSNSTLFEQVVHAISTLDSRALAQIARDIRCVGTPMYRIVLKEWLIVIQFMNTKAGLVRWDIEKPHFGADPSELDGLYKKIAPWQRNIELYENMVIDAMQHFLPREAGNSSSSSSSSLSHRSRGGGGGVSGVSSSGGGGGGSGTNDLLREHLRPDFLRVAARLQRARVRIDKTVDAAVSVIALEQSRREIEAGRRQLQAMQHSRGLTFLSILATIFLPLNFATSFFSMSADFSTESDTFGLFFALGIPLTVFVGGLVVVLQPGVRYWVRRRWMGESEGGGGKNGGKREADMWTVAGSGSR